MRRTVVVANPEGLHARPAAQFASRAAGFRSRVQVEKNGGCADAASILELLGLDVHRGDEITLVADGEDADEAVSTLADLLTFDRPTRELKGLGVSPGTGVGPVWVHRPQALRLPRRPVADVDAEIARAEDALREVSDDVSERATELTGDARAILEAQAAIAGDPVLHRDVFERIRLRRQPAARAVVDAGAARADRVASSSDPYLAARATDIREVCDRVARRLTGQPPPDLQAPEHPAIIVATDLSPADTAALDPRRIRGLITETGSPTSHTSILARSLEVPAVVGVHGVVDLVRPGAIVGLDGTTGVVYLDPDDATVRELREREAGRRARRRELARRMRGDTTATRDGHRVEVAANIRSIDELQVALQAGAEAVGLFRTELLYLERRTPPSEDEQAALLSRMCDLLGERRLVVRTLDVGADKPVAFLPHRHERNPELGIRGIRLAMRNPELLDAQVRAATRAAQEGGRIAVMAPMVATVAEAEWFLDRVARSGGREAGVEVGVMVEVPSAVLLAEELATRLDFLSIGTNDLAQYLHAADRRHADLAEYQDPAAPAILRAIEMVCDAAVPQGCWVGVCGEAASDPDWARVAVGLGVTELSMQASSILEVRAAIAGTTFEECRTLARAALERGGGP